MAVDAAAMTDTATNQATEAPAGTDGATGAPSGGAGAAAAPEIDIWAEVSKLDPDELIRRYPSLQGKVGSLAQQQAQRQIAAYQQTVDAQTRQEREAAERAEMRRLAQDNPDALAQRIQTDLIAKEYQEQQQRLLDAQQNEMRRAVAERLDRVMAKPIFQEVWNNSSPEVRAKLSWTSYNELDDFFEAANDIISDYRADKKADEKAEKLAKSRLEALQKEGAVEGVKTDATAGGADLNLDGLSTGDHIYTQQEIAANMHDPAWRKANMPKVNAQYQQGLIR